MLKQARLSRSSFGNRSGLLRSALASRRFGAVVLAGLLLLVACLALPPQRAYAADSANTTFTIQMTGTYNQTEARTMLSAINDWRADAENNWYCDGEGTKVFPGAKSALVYDYSLEKVAQLRAMEIAVRCGFGRPNGENLPYSAYGAAGVDSSKWTGGQTENITITDNLSSSAAFENLRGGDDYSGQGYRRNMLGAGENTPDFSHIGIACVKYASTYYWVQELGLPTEPYAGSAETEANDSQTSVNIEVAPGLVENAQLSATPSPLPTRVGVAQALPSVTAQLTIPEQQPSGSVSAVVFPTWELSSSGTCATLNASEGTITGKQVGEESLRATLQIGSKYTVDVPVEVSPAPSQLTDDMVSLSSPGVAYDGEAHVPEITVKDGDTPLEVKQNYAVTIKDAEGNEVESATDAGEYTVLIEGLDDYAGTVTRTFTIAPASLSSAMITFTEGGTYTYTGKEIKPAFTVTIGTTTLVAETDYAWKFSDNIDLGQARLSIEGKGNYRDTASGNFQIVGQKLTIDYTAPVDRAYAYDGTAHGAGDLVQVRIPTEGFTIRYGRSESCRTPRQPTPT